MADQADRADMIREDVRAHLDDLVPPRAPELQAMERYAAEHRFPIIGPACGYLCYQIARMIGARKVFELGSGYGYSTAWFARAVQENGGGVVHHVVWDEELSQMARTHLGKLGLTEQLEYHVGEAVQALQATDDSFDVVFNDIDKDGYPASLPVIADKLRPGGVLIIDNMLLQGRIFDAGNHDKNTEAVRETTRLLTTGEQWISSLVPIRDGMIVAFRR